jgi:2-oxoglutarate/2-oxoacid ferredoxin oxidoreductase subunit beta
MTTEARGRQKVNEIGLEFTSYKGSPTTLCQGCGHNSIANQIVQVAYEMNVRPHELVKLSGIGCSSKSPAYFLGMSHGFNALHGRMPAVGTGALMANHHLKAIGVSGDGDTGSIGMGQFKHVCRRNVRMVYIVENNGVYGLTKGQFSATADEGLELKYAGHNELPPIDICMEAIVAGAGFVARSFSGDPTQVRELLKAAMSHRGIAVLDIISPCVAFNNKDFSTMSYTYGKEHGIQLHEIGYIPMRDEIYIDEYAPGEAKMVDLHDGARIVLRKLESDYDPTDKIAAMSRLERAIRNREFITGLIYFDDSRPSLAELNKLDRDGLALADLPAESLRPSREKLQKVMDRFL